MALGDRPAAYRDTSLSFAEAGGTVARYRRRSAFPSQDDQCSRRGGHGLSEWASPHASRAAGRGGDGLGSTWGRSEERREGEECASTCRSRWLQVLYTNKKKRNKKITND